MFDIFEIDIIINDVEKKLILEFVNDLKVLLKINSLKKFHEKIKKWEEKLE